MEAMNIQVDFPSNPSYIFEDYFVLVFYLNSMHDATEKAKYPQLSEKPLILDLNFTFILDHVTELIASEEYMSSVTVDYFVVVVQSLHNTVHPFRVCLHELEVVPHQTTLFYATRTEAPRDDDT